jgi:hypothetical protein
MRFSIDRVVSSLLPVPSQRQSLVPVAAPGQGGGGGPGGEGGEAGGGGVGDGGGGGGQGLDRASLLDD